MGDATKIEWADATFNPWWGCTRVSPGCDFCYADTWAKRLGMTLWDNGARREFGDKHWNEPLKWARTLPTKLGRRPRVFCASMADVFDKNAPAGARERLWRLIGNTPNLDWLLLTKRIGNVPNMLPVDWGDGWANVWLGITTVNQEEADRDVPKLLAIPARTRFISYEPALGALKLRWEWVSGGRPRGGGPQVNMLQPWEAPEPLPRIDWLIAGGESGARARPAHPDWFRLVRDQCAAAGVAYLFKQWGEWLPFVDRDRDDPDWRAEYTLIDRKPEQYEILNLAGGRGFNGERVHLMKRVGKKVAGRMLDGRTHDDFPQ